eukprot:4624490-Prymnesium_polylepis.1
MLCRTVRKWGGSRTGIGSAETAGKRVKRSIDSARVKNRGSRGSWCERRWGYGLGPVWDRQRDYLRPHTSSVELPVLKY